MAEAAPSRADLPNAAYLREALVNDVHSLAEHIATLTIMIGAALRPGASWSLRACRHLIHDDFKPLGLALRFAAQIGLPAEVATQLEQICRSVGAAQARVAPLLALTSADTRQRERIAGLSQEWRRIAAAMEAALASIEAFERARLPGAYGEDLATLRAFLTQAAQNDLRAADEAGVVRAPAIKQRRRVPRVPVDTPCTLETPAGAHVARLENVSRYGLGLVCEATLSAGQEVKVALADGRKLSGAIVRCQRPRYGLTLADALSDADPLLAAGARHG